MMLQRKRKEKIPKMRDFKLQKQKKEKKRKMSKPALPKQSRKLKLPKELKVSKQLKLPKWMKLPENLKVPKLLQKKIGTGEQGKRVLTLSVRLLLLCLLPMIAACLMITIFSINRLRSSMETEIEKSLRIVATSVNETYTNLYEGDYSQDQSGKLKKGDIQISGENEFIDNLKEQTGFEVSFLYGNMRMITTLRKENGARINGVGIENSSYDIIKAGEMLFLTEYQVAGNEYYAYYQPLTNSDGVVIGAIEVAVEADSTNKMINSQVWGIIGMSLLLVALAAVAVIFLSRGLTNGMTAVKNFLEKIVNGELDFKPNEVQQNRNDEIGDIYRMAVSLQDTLYQIVKEINLSAVHLNESAGQLTDMAKNTNNVIEDVICAVAEISVGAKQQAEDTSDTNDNIMRMSHQIESIVGEVENLNRNATQMAQEENESERIIHELNESNNETKEAVMQVAEQISVMSNSIRDITTALDMIRNVADETTLLALNASIEAARVGEAGRGFAVVAQQINKLAEQSNASIGSIEKVIADVVSTSEKMVLTMVDVKSKMDQQQEKLDETMSKSTAVSSEVENSKQKIEMIRGNVDTLNEFGAAIGSAVGNLAEVSCQNAASADSTKDAANAMSLTMVELEEASVKLAELSKELEKSLGRFKL